LPALVQRSVDVGPPVAVTYQVTEAGAALMPALDALTSWAEANLPARSCSES
jgi:DNA-binding HxlR family transcriptional regulator